MPRRFSLLLGLLTALSLLFCAGCSSEPQTQEPPAVTGFSCDTDVSYQDMHVKGKLTRMEEGTLTFALDEPESLDGLTMKWDGETISFELYGMSFGVDPEQFRKAPLGQSIVNALDAVGQTEAAAANAEDGSAVVTGTSVSGEFELAFDPASGQLLSLRFPDLGMNATFSNFQTVTSETVE